MTALENFVSKIPKFDESTHLEKIVFFGYFITEVCNEPFFSFRTVTSSYEELNLAKPKNIHDLFSKLVNSKTIIPKNDGYALEGKTKKRIHSELDKPHTKEVEKSIQLLATKIRGPQEQEYFNEIVACYKIEAYRAAVVMTWILCIDHLYDYVLKNRVDQFNQALVKTKEKISVITTKDDFLEIRDEKRFIELCRTAGIITNDVRKILDEKLGTRNSWAHPSGIKIHPTKATNFLEEIVDNVILKY